MKFFRILGDLVTQRWKDLDYNEERFPEVATQALLELPPYHHVSLWDVVKWATQASHLPLQVDIEASFGDPPLTVYVGRGFRIEVLFWAQGIPSVHQHGFSGAFHVMRGSSIHSLWNFQLEKRVEMRLLLGRVYFKNAEILLQGDTRAILAGEQMYHATYHLDYPSVTVVVRTVHEADQQPQLALLPPTIAHAPLDSIPTVTRQTQLLRMLLLSGRRAEFQELARNLISTKDAYSTFEFLMATFGMVQDEVDRQQLILAARLKQPRLMEALEPALERDEVGGKIVHLYRSVESSDLKYFLALLRNIPKRQAVLSLIKHRYPGRDPVSLIAHWMRQLSALDVLGVNFHETWFLMLQCLLTESSVSDAEQTYLRGFSSNDGPRTEAQARELSTALQGYWLLQPLFVNDPVTQELQLPRFDATRLANV